MDTDISRLTSCDPLESQSHLDDYFNLVPEKRVSDHQGGKFKVRITESSPTNNSADILRWRGRESGRPKFSLPSIEIRELNSRPPCPIRIIFPGLDEPNPGNVEGLRNLYESCRVPSVFLKERVQGVPTSFGTRDPNSNTLDSWFHFLCKNIVLVKGLDGEPTICGPRPLDNLKANSSSWIQGGFFMKWHKTGRNILLCCFGTFPKIEERLRTYIENLDNVQSALYDPYALYVIIIDELQDQMNAIIWDLISVFNARETEIFEFAHSQQRRSNNSHEVDFEQLHNLEKLVIHLKEGCDATIQTLTHMRTAHDDLRKASELGGNELHPAIPATEKDLRYLLGSFQSLNLRLRSVETRTKNTINLAFNLVIQRDSTLLQNDSASMKTVAVMTLVFLPGTAVATIFGTQFVNSDGKGKLEVSQDFWMFWVLAALVTAITILVWYIWLKVNTKRRRFGEQRKVSAMQQMA